MSKKLEHNNLIAKWLDNSLTQSEKEALESSGELDALKTVIEDIDTWKVKPFNTEEGLAKLKQDKQKILILEKNKKRNFLRMVASIALLISFGALWFFMNTGKVTETTKIAEKKSIELPNGSLVELDAASAVTFYKKDWEDQRNISLTGQAFFNVTKGAPFVVKTPTAKVTVLGTKFNIKAEKEDFSVYCYEGSILVSYQDKKQTLKQGQSVILKNNTLLKKEHQITSPDWMLGYSKYESTLLINVIQDLKRYYNLDLSLPKKYENQKFTGIIHHNNKKVALEELFTTMEINYTIKESGNIIIY